MDRSPLESLSIPVRLLIIFCLLGVGGATVAYTVWVSDQLPPGSYPVFFFVMPGLVAAALVFAAGLAVFRFFGIPFWNPSTLPPEEADSPDGPLGP
jgi:hypothetical protein